MHSFQKHLRLAAVGFFGLCCSYGFSQTMARVQIKRTQNGVTTEEVRTFELKDGQDVNDVLKAMGVMDEFGQLKDGQQFSINIEKKQSTIPDQRLEFNYALPVPPPSTNPRIPQMAPLTVIPGSENRPYLGVQLRNGSAKVGKKTESGAEITDVKSESPAFVAEMYPGDVIIDINGSEIHGAQDVLDYINTMEPGQEVKITFIRDNKKKKVNLELANRPADMLAPEFTWPFNEAGPSSPLDLNIFTDSILIKSPMDSILISQPFCFNQPGMCESKVAYLGVTPGGQESDKGVTVEVMEGTAAATMGLRTGDVIVEMNGEPMRTFDDLASFVSRQQPEATVEIVVLRDGKEKKMEGRLGCRTATGNIDFRIFHNDKGVDEYGNYLYDFEFDMDNEDIEQKMQGMIDDLRRQQEELQGQLQQFRDSKETISISLEIMDITAEEAAKVNEAAEPKLETGNDLSLENLSFFPNPTNGVIQLKFETKEKGNLNVIVYDSAGNKVYLEEQNNFIGTYNNSIDISRQPSGTFFLQIKLGNKSYSKKLVKG